MVNKGPLFIGILIILIIVGAWLFLSQGGAERSLSKTQQASNLPGNTHLISMTSEGFVPEEITIKKGETVTWVNESDEFRWPASNLHPTHGIYPEFDPRQPIAPGDSWSFTFDKVGSWRYHDHLQPRLRGIVMVEE